jgi:hypothetical protein
MPFVGQLFYEDKILQLATLGKWEAVINESKTALSMAINENSFIIWYHKGLAECVTNQFDQC